MQLKPVTMPLEEYRRKRDFKKTPEPAPEAKSPAKDGFSYFIQKHAATRLHYDLRLECQGVLLSWAVTKGPSLNPADKRLAVRTEDHPLAYGTFEGTIPKGEYGGGTVMLWDRGTWEPRADVKAGLKKGHLAFTLHGERLRGDWDLIRMNRGESRENWLLIKVDDAEAKRESDGGGFLDNNASSVKTGRSMDDIAANKKAPPRQKKKPAGKGLGTLPDQYPSVQLATLVDQAPDGAEWLHEIKFDGYRLLAFLAGEEVLLRTRNGLDWTSRFPAIRDAVAQCKAGRAVIDMEAVVLDENGKSQFQSLQAALAPNGPRDTIMAYGFDLLHIEDEDITALPLLERKRRLQGLLKKSKTEPVLRFSKHVAGSGTEVLTQSCELGLEGIVSKRADAPYRPGRQNTWLKAKCTQRQEFIILGYSQARKGDRALGALYLGYNRSRKLQYAGKVGTGFTMKSARTITGRLEPLRVKTPVLPRTAMPGIPGLEYAAIHWVKPTLLCEVNYTEWTSDGHIRHPSFQGLREDKEAKTVKKEEPVAVMKKDEGHYGITITNPDRVISETGQVTKGELADYYAEVALYLMPHVAGYPLSLLRCPQGIDNKCFYQRNPGQGLGGDVHPFEFHHKGKTYEYLYIKDERGLLSLIQMGAVELHPWGAQVDAIDYPRRMIFDLDPAADVDFKAVKLAAEDLGQRLQTKGLQSTVKCTGGKGLHVTVPLLGKDPWPSVKTFAAELAAEMVADTPRAYVATMTKAKRVGKIFIDYFRNDYTATAVADYSVRAVPGATVAAPLEWADLAKLRAPNQFSMKDTLARLKKGGPATAVPEQRLPQS